MTIERKSVVDQIELPRDGGIQVRLALLMVEDGKELDSKWHRTFIPSDISPAIQMAVVNQHLTEMGMAEVSNEDVQRVCMFHKYALALPSTHQRAVPETAVMQEAKTPTFKK